ncbi:ABC-2 transporter permease [Kitasatospora sp. NPDC059648]|uniref:ABC-2 transporter permease n=1 Tax=Kitasatospora sp. NPDC059648 TaxID=3346894 RepID=UPI0036A3FAE3
MSAVARMAVLHLRTVAPYRAQGLLVSGMMVLVLARNPVGLVPALALLLAPLVAVHPFVVADKAGLETLYAVLPVPRRTVLLGHYAWALAGFLTTVTAGTALSVLLARAEGESLSGRTLLTMLTLSWALFAVNIAIQLPLLIRFGYARISVLGTTLPLALIMLAVFRLHLTIASIQLWLPLLWVAGAAAIVTSAALATHVPKRRT